MATFRLEDIPPTAKFGLFLFRLASGRLGEPCGPGKIAEALYQNYDCYKIIAPSGRTHKNSNYKSQDMAAISKAVKRHLCRATAADVPSNYLLAYSTLFNCSMDYLYGRIEEDCPNMDVLKISKYLNISCEAIQSIQELTRGEHAPGTIGEFCYQKRAAVNLTLSAPQFRTFITRLCLYATKLENLPKAHNYLEEVCKNMDPQILEEATFFLQNGVDEENHPQSEEVEKAYYEMEQAIDKGYAEKREIEHYEKLTKLAKYELLVAMEDLEKYLEKTPSCSKLAYPELYADWFEDC